MFLSFYYEYLLPLVFIQNNCKFLLRMIIFSYSLNLLSCNFTPVQERPLAAVVSNILHRFGNRSILGRGQKSIAFGLG